MEMAGRNVNSGSPTAFMRKRSSSVDNPEGPPVKLWKPFDLSCKKGHEHEQSISDDDGDCKTDETAERRITSRICDKFLKIEKTLSAKLCSLEYNTSGVTHVSNPIEHAWIPHKMFVEKYLTSTKSVLFLGMNPGPWGMCQTGRIS